MSIAEAESGIWYNEDAFGGKVNLRSISFGFDRFANEGKTAVFKIEDCVEEFMSEIMGRVSYCIDAESTIENPGHLVYFRRLVNDTEVPDLAVDARSREIGFDWRAMFSRFLAERKLNCNILERNVCLLIGLSILLTSLLTRSSYSVKRPECQKPKNSRKR